ncbi:MAG: hypothetical protein WC380_00315, partial [Pedobacter sp.]
MKKLLFLLLFPLWVQAQTNVTVRRDATTGIVSTFLNPNYLDTLPRARLTGITNGQSLIWNSTLKMLTPYTLPSVPIGLQDSLTKKANRTFDNVASGAIAKAKVDTSATGLQTVSNFFPKGDTRYLRGTGTGVASVTGTANQITVTGTSTPVLSIPSTFIAPGSIAATTGVSGTTGTFAGDVTATGLFSNTTYNSSGTLAANFANSNASGYGGKIRGGSGSLYSFLVTDYNDASLLNISPGVGATFGLRLKSPDFDWIRQSNFGYASVYKTQIIGATTGNQTIAFGVDPISNVGATFSGNGSEYMFRNAGKFITPNSGNTDYTTLLSWNSSGGVLYPTLSGSGNVITGADNTGLLGKITIGSGLSLTSGVLTATGGSSGSVTTAGGTSGKIAKFTSASNIENSIMTEAGSDIAIAG